MATCPECRNKFPDDVENCPQDGKTLVPDALLAKEDDGPLSEGAMVGEYRIQHKIGAGTFGDVYAGEQPVIGKRVAVKVLNRRFASDPVMVSRFVAEARAVNKIRQRNIIDIFSFGTIPGTDRHYFVMELLDGMTLGAMLNRTGRLPVALILPVVKGIADALDAVHEAGITHRDLKPDNVFLARERDGTYFPKLLDFGIAKLLDEEVAHKTGSGIVLGTPRYMSPEQARGKKADHRSDIYALGVIIHEMLTGGPLFEGESAVDLLLKQAVDPPPRMSEICPDLPPGLDEPVLQMLEKRPDARPSSAGKAVAGLAARARELGLDQAKVTLDQLAAEGPPTDEKGPKFAGTTVTVGPKRGPSTPPLSPASPLARSSDPMSKTERAPVSAAATLKSNPVAQSATPVVSEPIGVRGPTTESVSAVETSSTVRRLTRARRARIIAGSIVAAALAFALWAGAQRRPATAAGTLPAATATATATAEPLAHDGASSSKPASPEPSTPTATEPMVRPVMTTPPTASADATVDAGSPTKHGTASHPAKPAGTGRNLDRILGDR